MMEHTLATLREKEYIPQIFKLLYHIMVLGVLVLLEIIQQKKKIKELKTNKSKSVWIQSFI